MGMPLGRTLYLLPGKKYAAPTTHSRRNRVRLKLTGQGKATRKGDRQAV